VLLEIGESHVELLAPVRDDTRTGIRGSRIAFLEPDGTGHVLTELVQPAPGF
jgi:hypothetical protein